MDQREPKDWGEGGGTDKGQVGMIRTVALGLEY